MRRILHRPGMGIDRVMGLGDGLASRPDDRPGSPPAPPVKGRPAARWQRQAAVLIAASALAVTAATASAAPSTPTRDDEVVQRLPQRPDRALRQQRAALAQAPQQLPLALATARQALDRARQLGDPRELGLAQAALAPWWALPDPPAAVRLLRGTVLQSLHQFEPALADLEAVARDARAPLPLQAQAGLTRATVLQVTGRLDDARQGCEALLDARFQPLGPGLSRTARACLAELRSLRGEPRPAAQALAALAREAPDDAWLALVRAELAERLGDQPQAGALYRQASADGSELYAVAAHADWLLARRRPADALALLDRSLDRLDPAALATPARVAPAAPGASTRATAPAAAPALPPAVDGAAQRLARAADTEPDALLLRRALALRQLQHPGAAALAQTLQQRFDAAAQRGERLHAREEARLALDLLDQPQRALALARDNWARQKEPADALLLQRAALAAGQPEAAAPVHALVRDAGWSDVRLMHPAARTATLQPGPVRSTTTLAALAAPTGAR